MSALLFGHDDSVAEWVGKQNGKPFHPPYTAFGVLNRHGTLIGGFVFTSYTQESVELSLAGYGCIARDAWRAVLNYVCAQLGCVRLQVHTRKTNKTVRQMAPKAGLVFEGVARRLYGKEDGLAYSLTSDDLPTFRKRWKL